MNAQVCQAQILGYLRSNHAVELMINATLQGRAALEGVVHIVERFMEGQALTPSFHSWIGKVIAREMRPRGFEKTGQSLSVKGSKFFAEAAVYVRL